MNQNELDGCGIVHLLCALFCWVWNLFGTVDENGEKDYTGIELPSF